MTILHRLLGIGCLVVMSATASQPQVTSAAGVLPSGKTIENWLLSGDPRLVAWGAHFAMVAHDRRLVPDLLSMAANWQNFPTLDSDGNPVGLSQEQKDQRDAMAAIVDALIQLHAAVPTETLRSLAPNFGNEVAVLLSQMTKAEAEPLALDFYHSPKPAPLQYVSASLLALNPPPGFAADMLSNITVRATIFVADPGAGLFGTGGAGDCFVASAVPGKDWPAIGQYALSKTKDNGTLLVVGGVDPIYGTRRELGHYSGDHSMACGVGLGPDQRLRLTAEMLGVDPASMPWNTAPHMNIVFQSPEQYQSALLALVRDEQQKYRTTTAALAERGLITPSEADDPETMPRLYLQVNDMRKDAAPLPELANLPPRVEAHGPIF